MRILHMKCAYNIVHCILFFIAVNHSCNFWLYSISGTAFRQELISMITCRKTQRSSAMKKFLSSLKTNDTEMKSIGLSVPEQGSHEADKYTVIKY